MGIKGKGSSLPVGRPDKAEEVKMNIIEFLKDAGFGSVDQMRREIRKRRGISYSWNTLKKYAEELVEEGKITKHVPEPSLAKYSKSRPVYFIGVSRRDAVARRLKRLGRHDETQ